MCPDTAQKLQRSRFLLHESHTEIYRGCDYPVDFLPEIKSEEAEFFYHKPATEQPRVRVKVVVAYPFGNPGSGRGINLRPKGLGESLGARGRPRCP